MGAFLRWCLRRLRFGEASLQRNNRHFRGDTDVALDLTNNGADCDARRVATHACSSPATRFSVGRSLRDGLKLFFRIDKYRDRPFID